MKIKKWSHFLESLQTPLTENDKEEIGKALIKSVGPNTLPEVISFLPS